tara:strand:- start:378 stop:899 length:522 start_codon:yes stop_codon:yes gene_type:complete
MSDIPRLNIDELYERKKETDTQRVSIYNKLLVKIHNKIKLSSRLNVEDEFCYYIMPEILIGYPNYNFQECIMYIVSCLEDDGFLIKYIHPNLLLISWRHWVPQYVREEVKKKTGKSIDKFGNEIVEKENPFKMKDKKVSFKDSQQNKSYKKGFNPSGKFVYSNDVLSTIKEML